MSENRQIFTLKQVALSIQKTIKDRYQTAYWVQAEMHKLNYTNKGHCYPELVHKENNEIITEMRATIWKSNFDEISKNFANIVKEPIREGLNLLMLVKINYHPIYSIGLEIIDIDPTYSLGELEKERKETLLRLEREGLINKNQRLSFPLLPKRIAIISMGSSKGYSDFCSIIDNNPNEYRFFTFLFEAQLNGDAAIYSIQNQLNKIEKVKHHFDIVLIIRGGGGEVGMSCYNNYHLAKAIALFPLPVLTGIGHSTNITVAEMVAFRNAITPSELAEILIHSFYEVDLLLKNGRKSITQQANYILNNKKQELRNKLRT
jgi:exodeoxyribonuclease VII large subunit